MKKQYEYEDIWKLKKSFELVLKLDGIIFVQSIDDLFKKGAIKNLIFKYCKDFTKEALPGLTHNRLEVITHEYKVKKAQRECYKNVILKQENKDKRRLMPLKHSTYVTWAEVSKKHFAIIMQIQNKRIFGGRD